MDIITSGVLKVEPEDDINTSSQAAKVLMLEIHQLFNNWKMRENCNFTYDCTHSEENENVIIKISCKKSNFALFESNDHMDSEFDALPVQVKIEKVDVDLNEFSCEQNEEIPLIECNVERAIKNPLKTVNRKVSRKSDNPTTNHHTCQHCNKSFKNRKSLLNHVKYHSEDKSITCEVCGFKSSDKWKLKRHLATHSVERKFTCSLCGKSYRHSYNVIDHMRRAHPDGDIDSVDAKEPALKPQAARFKSKFRYVDGVKVYECEICGKDGFKDRKLLMKHRQMHTDIVELNVSCHMCNFTTKSRESLRSHIHNVHKEKQLVCDICGTRYGNKTSLKDHIDAVHLLKKDFCCHICGKSYSRLRTLQKHLNYHTAEKKIVCEICGFKSVETGRMNRHKRSHTGVRNYSCDICGKMFVYSYNVNLHKKLVHFGGKQKTPSSDKLTCHICNKKFQRIQKVQDHMREVHGVLDVEICKT